MRKKYWGTIAVALAIHTSSTRAEEFDDQIGAIYANTNQLLGEVAAIRSAIGTNQNLAGIAIGGAMYYSIRDRCSSIIEERRLIQDLGFAQVVARRVCAGLNFVTVRRTDNELWTFLESDIILSH